MYKNKLLFYTKGVIKLKTKRGIELDLNKTEYIVSIYGYSFYFSSLFYKEKFEREMKNFSEVETQKIKVKNNIKISMEIYFLFALYKKIEKRGFKVISQKDGKELTENISFICSLI